MEKNLKVKNGGLSFKKKNNTKYFGTKNLVDPETGTEIPVRIIGTNYEFVDTKFFKVFTAFSRRIIEDSDIAGKSIRLLFYIMAEKVKHIDEIEFYMSPSEVCRELNVSERTYRRWISTLIKKDIIIRIEPNRYKINPTCVCVGKANRLVEQYYKTGTE